MKVVLALALSTNALNVARNPNFAKLQGGYPFPEHILSGLVDGAAKLGTQEGYSGYGAEQGMGDLRQRIAESCYANTNIKADEVFVSDGAKCDIARLQIMFGSGVTSAVQDPSYPAYLEK